MFFHNYVKKIINSRTSSFLNTHQKGTFHLKTYIFLFFQVLLKTDFSRKPRSQKKFSSTMRSKKEDEYFECNICHKSFGQKLNMQTNVNIVHKKQKNFQCDICKKSFGYKGDLKKHFTTVHENQRNFKCNTCQKMFGSRPVLKKHIDVVHEKQKNFQCNICQKSFG